MWSGFKRGVSERALVGTEKMAADLKDEPARADEFGSTGADQLLLQESGNCAVGDHAVGFSRADDANDTLPASADDRGASRAPPLAGSIFRVQSHRSLACVISATRASQAATRPSERQI
jgi:hypothetical protein